MLCSTWHNLSSEPCLTGPATKQHSGVWKRGRGPGIVPSSCLTVIVFYKGLYSEEAPHSEEGSPAGVACDCPTFITPTFITSDIHHPLPNFRHSSPQTFITSDVHHLRHSSPQTFITSDFHHPLPKIRHSSPRTFITPDIHHLRHSSEVMNV